MPFGSKGYRRRTGHCRQRRRSRISVARPRSEGALPVVVDTSPCAYALTHGEGLSDENRERLDAACGSSMRSSSSRPASCPALPLRRRARHGRAAPGVLAREDGQRAAARQPRCGLQRAVRSCRRRRDAAASPVTAGSRVPELTAAATRIPAAEVRAVTADGHYSSSRTCEIGMSRATGRQLSIVDPSGGLGHGGVRRDWALGLGPWALGGVEP